MSSEPRLSTLCLRRSPKRFTVVFVWEEKCGCVRRIRSRARSRGNGMCGICGVWGGGGREAVGAMVGAMYHRGPDDSGALDDRRAALGMTRLAIIDTSSGGHQPMLSEDGQMAVVYNGQLYNFRDDWPL